MKSFRFTISLLAVYALLSLTAQDLFAFEPSSKKGFAEKIFQRFEAQFDKQMAMFMSPCILLTNTDLNTNLTGWTVSGTVTSITDAFAGARAVELASSWATMSQTRTGITAGRVYMLSVQAKIEGAPDWVPVKLEFLNGSGTVLSSSLFTVSTTTYTLHQQGATAPTGATSIRVTIEKSGAGKLKLDEFCLQEFVPAIGECTLVGNPGFENGLAGWGVWNTTVTNVTDVKSGASAARLGNAEGSIYRSFAITPGETYEYSAWSKVGSGTTWAEIYLNWKDVNGNNISSPVQPVNLGATTYQRYSIKGKAPSNAVYMEIGAYKQTGGLQFIDDICVSRINPLGGTSFDLSCGCSENRIPNGGFESTTATTFGTTLDGRPSVAIPKDNTTTILPWTAALTGANMFLVNDATNAVNNPEGSRYVYLPNSGDCFTSRTNFSNNLLLEDGETYTFCFYAASRSLGMNSSGMPNGTIPTVQHSGTLALEFDFVSGFKAVNVWAVPASESATNLSWTKFEYTFTYDITDPINSFTFTNFRPEAGVYLDAVSLSKVNCPAAITCSNGGINFDRWGGISGVTTDNLVTSVHYPNSYNETGFLTSFQSPLDYSNDYGTRVYGYLVPPVTGNYTFTVTSGDASKLFLSTNASQLNETQIAEVTGFTGQTEFTKFAAQTSTPRALVAGQPYFIELIHKAGSVNSDHFQVYWQTPSNSTRTIIPGSALRPICSVEVCDNGRDDDFDNLRDCADPDCASGLTASSSVVNEGCGVANGSIALTASGASAPFSYRWSDITESARWNFDDNLNDVSGNGRHAVNVVGFPVYDNDAREGRKSLYFNGATAVRYNVAGGFMTLAANNLTVSMWIKPEGLTGNRILFEEGGTDATAGAGIALQLSNSTLQARVKRTGGTGTSHVFNAGSLTFPNDGNWHHVAMVFAAGRIRLYLDGVGGTETNATAQMTSIEVHANNGGIGGAHGGSVFHASEPRFYRGRMDDVRYYYNTALTPQRIADMAANNGSRAGLTAGTYNVTVTSATGCSITRSIPIISSGNHTNGGTITGTESGCGSSFNPALITNTTAPSPGVGTTEYVWQQSTNGGTTWTDIASTNTATYDPPTISATTHYRRGARLLPCSGWVYSNSVVKSLTANFTGSGSISADESRCGGYDPLIMIGTAPTSGSDITWKVDPPVSGSANGAVYTVTNQGGEPMFLTVTGANVTKVTVKGGTPTATYTTPPFVNLTSPINPNNGQPFGISHFDIWVSGAVNGTTEYKWQSSIDDGITWTDIPSTNAANYDPPFISQTTRYRRGVRVAECSSLAGGGWLFTNVVTKTVELNVTDAGIIVGDEENCGSFDPGVISSVSTPSGGAGGTLIYQWQLSTNGGTTWTDILGASLGTLDPITITTTTRYRRGARRSTCSNFIYSNEVVKMVVANFTNPGLLTGNESNCSQFDPAPITSTALPSGGVDGYTAYRWQKSFDNGVTWEDIAGATSPDFDPVVTVTATTLYRRQARRAPCTAWINSNTITKEVKSMPVSSIAFGPTTTNGFLCEATAYAFQATDAGVGATYSWNFGSFATPSTASGIGPFTVTYNVPNSVAFTTVPVQLTVTRNGCTNVSTTNYNVRPPLTISSVVPLNPSSCTNANGRITVNASSPAGTSLEASINGTTWIAPPFVFNNLGPGNYNVWVRYSGDECMVWWGDQILEEAVNPNPTFTNWNQSSGCVGSIFTVTGSAASGSTVTWDFGPGATPATATGLGPHSLTYSTGGVKTMRISATRNGCTAYEERNFTVIQNFTDAGIIGNNQSLCANGVPSPMSSLVYPSGGFGGTTYYAWEFRQQLGTVWSNWATISGATGSSYAPGSISVNTEYRRRTLRWPCGTWLYSNVVSKNVTQLPVATNDAFDNACPGFTLVGYVGTNDSNLDDPIFSIISQPFNGFLDMDVDGEFYYIPNTTFCGGDQFVYQVCNNTTGCCATATAFIDMSDSDAPSLNNIPADMEVSCDDELPQPPVVDAFENCGNVWLSFDQTATQGADSCSIYSYLLTRVWTASDYCGNSQIDQQVITISDETAPNIYRIYTLPNGKRMIAGVMDNVSQRWKTIAFPVQFDQQPVVLTQVVSKNDGAAVVTRLRNVSTSQFQMRLQEEEGADGVHGRESVAWVAIEKGASSQGFPFEANSRLVSSVTTTANFSQSYTEPGFIGQIQTFNENNPATVRYNTLSSSGVAMFCQEETSLDPEMNHGFETVGYLAFAGTGDIRNQGGEIVGEAKKVTVDHNFQTITFSHRYHNPVVVLGGLSMTDATPATIRVQNLTLNSFQVQIDEWDYLDGVHGPQALSYIVVEGSIPFDQEVECSAVPAKPTLGVEIDAVDNCDISTPLIITDSEWNFNCQSDTTMTRTFYVRDECGNFTELTQTFTLRDTTPPTFTVPSEITITCNDDKDNLVLTGDVTDEADNCADGLEATYEDNLSFQTGCGGYVLRLWTLEDYCGNSVTKTQIIRYMSGNDTDGDGVADDLDLDNDNDGIPNLIETNTDTDGDGVPNTRDIDCDNDGITDIIEAGFVDEDGDGMVDNSLQPGWDGDEDGYANGYDSNDYNSSSSSSVSITNFITVYRDADNDGVLNFVDLDSDNDGIPDIIEAGGVDNNGDGRMDYPVPGDPTSMEDSDSDGYASVYDPDEDSVPGSENYNTLLGTYDGNIYSTGIPTYSFDSDNDKKPDFLDLDSDNDGIPDLIEVGGVDENGDGRVDVPEFEDAVKDGFHDNYVANPRVRTKTDGSIIDGRPEDTDGTGTVYLRGDDDNDGIVNFLDRDVDGDGIFDIAELRMNNFDTDGDGIVDNIVDTNNNGFHDAIENVGFVTTDPDGTNDDGEPTDDADFDSSPYITVMPDGFIGEINNQPDVDDDGDGVLNFRDTDSDNDGILDNFEDRNRNGIVEVGELNPLHSDSDGDDIPDGTEDTNLNGFFDVDETNPLLIDTDSDLLTDSQEDVNFDGIVNFGESDPRDACNPFLSNNCVGVAIQVKAMLQGPTIGAGGSDLMKDNLRAKGYVPSEEPYKEIDMFRLANDGGSEVCDPALLMVEGNDAVVDWMLVELRHGTRPDSIVATRSCLLQRDGDLMGPNGDTILQFNLVRSGEYYISIRHRNHLGAMTEERTMLSPTPTLFDFRDASLPVKGNYTRVDLGGGMLALWGGDYNNNRQAVYQGPNNDILTLFFHIMTHGDNNSLLANFISSGYLMTDFDLDGNSIYQGPNNDRSNMLIHTTLNNSANVNNFANFVVQDKLPETNLPAAAPICGDDKTVSTCDYDEDGTINDLDTDDDNDGVKDSEDINPYNPNSDSDADGITDNVETGGDGRYNSLEDSNPLVQDSDGDGLKDGQEDVNKNGVQDANESNPIDRCSPVATTSLCDFDGDGIINAFDLDDDNDGVADARDVADFNTNSDSDNDGITDGQETGNDGIYHAGTDSNPLNACDPSVTSTGGCLPKDLDNDGFFENYPVTHDLFDQNDANPCIPNSAVQSCPCEDTDGDGKIVICSNAGSATQKTRSISLWLWPLYAAQGGVCGPCQN